MHLFMFDIDGTLLESFDLDSRCYVAAVQDVLNIRIDNDWSKYRHVTDSGILKQVIEECGVVARASSVLQEVKARFLHHLSNHFEQTRIKPIPGASEFLTYLKNRHDVCLALATGGWAESAQLKLSLAKLDTHDLIISTSSDHHIRTEIMRLSENHYSDTRFTTKTYFGDGDWDREAAKELGYQFIMVGNRMDHKPAIINYLDIPDIMNKVGL